MVRCLNTNHKDTNFKEHVKHKPHIFKALNFVHSYQCEFVHCTNRMRSIVRLVGIINKYMNHIPYLLISNSAGSIACFIPPLSHSFQSELVYLNTKNWWYIAIVKFHFVVHQQKERVPALDDGKKPINLVS